MSLFKVRDWWSVQCGEEGGFDHGLLCVTNIDNVPDGTDKIIVANQEKGLIQIYEPKVVLNETSKEGDVQNTGTLQGFRPDDLLLEYNLDNPVLQIACGNFVSTLQQTQLAVLHPRKLSVYSITGSKGAVEHGSQYQMTLAYEHKLQRSSYCLVIGPFGEAKGKDLLAVLSLDGVLSFFEQESFAFSRFLPGFLLPGPIIYVKKTDSLVTISSSFHVESFKYRTLAVAKDPDETQNEGQRIAGSVQKGKRVTADWTFSLGEIAIDIAVTENPNSYSIIYVLGKKNIFTLKDNGMLHWMKKLDYEPCCFLPYHALELSPMLLVCTVNRTILVYNEQTMKWAAQLPIVPVAVRRCNLSSLEGVLVSLGSQGTLACSYLGTDPSLLVAPPPTSLSDINYSEAEKELKQLKAVISGTLNDKSSMPMMSQNIAVQISVHLPQLNPGETASAFISVQLLVRQEKVRNVRLSLFVAPPLAVFQSVHCFSELMPGDAPTQISASVLIPEGHDGLVTSLLKIRATVVYYNDSDTSSQIDSSTVPHLVESAASLPLVIALQAVAPVKVAAYKLTLDSNKPCVDLQKLFFELSWEELAQDNAIGFQYRNSDRQNPLIVSILASKTSQRYRIQSSSFGALWLPTSLLIQRLQKYYHKEKNFKIGIPTSGAGSQLPLAEFMAEVEDHYQARKQKQQFDQMLEQSAAQFRIIQKRLLIKTKDKSALPLNNLDVLLDASYHQLLSLSEAAWHSLLQIERSACSLACSASLVKMLAILQQKEGTLTDVQRHILEASLSDLSLYNSISGSEQGWEEHTHAALIHLINPGENGHTLGKGNNLSFLQPQDLAKLRKHLTLVLMRASKGTLTPKKIDEEEHKEEPPSPEEEQPSPEEEQRDVGDVDL